ncbi:MaoC/PaaZ C-terminal domain-containing protein [Hydrogenophaga sp.]|uniref:MaoC/PaaZ C-terminal domain-containing protein n=1 Tax=Hydrogenophaga sp. TaxID=1904254 RepID=UPI0027294F4A|nr:MaoC/PaaZ C-terminal domain-containing protein [Hydrogenophaga sp.]
MKVTARNISAESSNKIHDDEVARKLGFEGALVPGAEIHAYMSRIPVAKWGRAWLQSGSIEARFVKPVYAGQLLSIHHESTDKHTDSIGVFRDEVCCATGRAWMGKEAVHTHSPLRPHAMPNQPLPPANEKSLAKGVELHLINFRISADEAVTYLETIEETSNVYRDAKLVHPGLLVRMCNRVVYENVELGPWAHTASKITNFSLPFADEEYTVGARVIENFEKRGNSYVNLDMLIHAGERPIARVSYEAIYRLRKPTEPQP